jgi:hypothetical protein
VGLTDEGGLLILQDDQWRHITTAEGLPSNTINDLAYDRDGSLWIATDQPGGVGTFDGTTFSASPELAEVRGVTLYLDPDGGLWLGTDYEGVWRFDSQSWSRYGDNEQLLNPVILPASCKMTVTCSGWVPSIWDCSALAELATLGHENEPPSTAPNNFRNRRRPPLVRPKIWRPRNRRLYPHRRYLPFFQTFMIQAEASTQMGLLVCNE